MLQLFVIPALTDNYIYIVRDDANDVTLCIDPAEAAPVEERLAATGWRLTHILNTHHHGDHTGGNEELVAKYQPQVIGSASDAARIPCLTQGVRGGDTITIGSLAIKVFEVPGHTSGHIAYWLAEDSILFSGDALFSFGCGRIFEGTAEQMWSSLKVLRDLPDDTLLYCGHEYTESNIRFALTVDPDNATLRECQIGARERRALKRPTVPGRMGLEKLGNPFLRADQPAIKARLNMTNAPDFEVLGAIRKLKDNFT